MLNENGLPFSESPLLGGRPAQVRTDEDYQLLSILGEKVA